MGRCGPQLCPAKSFKDSTQRAPGRDNERREHMFHDSLFDVATCAGTGARPDSAVAKAMQEMTLQTTPLALVLDARMSTAKSSYSAWPTHLRLQALCCSPVFRDPYPLSRTPLLQHFVGFVFRLSHGHPSFPRLHNTRLRPRCHILQLRCYLQL